MLLIKSLTLMAVAIAVAAVVALAGRRLLRIDKGSVSDAWRAEHRGQREQ